MNIEQIMEQFSHLPIPAQIFLFVLVLFFNPTGIIAGAIAVYNVRQKAAIKRQAADDKLRYEKEIGDQKVRLEAVETNQLEVQSRIEHTRATNDNMKELIGGVFRSDERWQGIMDTISQRRLEGERLITEAIERQTVVVRDLRDVLEVQSVQFGNVKTTVEDSMKTVIQATVDTHKAVDSQKEELQLVNKSLANLTIRIDDLITVEESHVLDEATRHDSLKSDNREQKTELAAIKDGILTTNSILDKILRRMELTAAEPPTVSPFPQAGTPASAETSTPNTEDKLSA